MKLGRIASSTKSYRHSSRVNPTCLQRGANEQNILRLPYIVISYQFEPILNREFKRISYFLFHARSIEGFNGIKSKVNRSIGGKQVSSRNGNKLTDARINRADSFVRVKFSHREDCFQCCSLLSLSPLLRRNRIRI